MTRETRVTMHPGAAAFVAVTLLAGAATAGAGPIGFVGLMVPHAVRRFTGPDWRWILAYSTVGQLQRWDTATGRAIYPDTEGEGHTRPVAGVKFSENAYIGRKVIFS